MNLLDLILASYISTFEGKWRWLHGIPLDCVFFIHYSVELDVLVLFDFILSMRDSENVD